MIRCIWKANVELPTIEPRTVILALRSIGIEMDASIYIVTEGNMIGLDITEEVFGNLPDLFELFEAKVIPIVLQERGVADAEVELVGYQNI